MNICKKKSAGFGRSHSRQVQLKRHSHCPSSSCHSRLWSAALLPYDENVVGLSKQHVQPSGIPFLTARRSFDESLLCCGRKRPTLNLDPTIHLGGHQLQPMSLTICFSSHLSLHRPPLFCSRNSTFFFTTGSYLRNERGRAARGRRNVL